MKVEIFYKYYLYNIHTMINKIQFTYEFARIRDKKPIFQIHAHPSEIFQFYKNNPYLYDYSKSQIKLAEDILKNGMYCAFFGGKLKNPIDPSYYFLIQGVHRFYALKKYDHDDYIKKLFLFINFPVDIQYFKSNLPIERFDENPVYFYRCEQIGRDIRIIKTPIVSFSEALKFMDIFGTHLGRYIYRKRKEGFEIHPPKILEDEEMFNKFINSPLDFNLDDIYMILKDD